MRGEFNAAKTPDRPSGKALAAAFDKFLITPEEIVNKDLDEIVKTFADAKLPLNEKSSKIDQTLKRIGEREKPALTELQNVQQAFANDYNIKLIKQ